MIKEDKNADFLTTGRQPSEEDFARISEWIKNDKQKKTTRLKNEIPAGRKHLSKHGVLEKAGGR
jgi:hypothetical protein